MSDNPYAKTNTSGLPSQVYEAWEDGFDVGAASRNAEVAKNNEYSRKLYQELCQKVSEVAREAEANFHMSADLERLRAEVAALRKALEMAPRLLDSHNLEMASPTFMLAYREFLSTAKLALAGSAEGKEGK